MYTLKYNLLHLRLASECLTILINISKSQDMMSYILFLYTN